MGEGEGGGVENEPCGAAARVTSADAAVVYAPPMTPPAALPIEPLLASWEAKGHASQVALVAYLDAFEEVVSAMIPAEGEHMAIGLKVGIQPEKSLTTGGRDLDNYAFPVISRLRSRRVAAVFVEKAHGIVSTIAAGEAVPGTITGEGWFHVSATTTVSADLPAWKAELVSQVPHEVVGGDALDLQIAYRLSSRRNWAVLWKLTIDALGGILGVENPNRPSHPRDDRITHLGVHRTLDDSIGWSVHIDPVVAGVVPLTGDTTGDDIRDDTGDDLRDDPTGLLTMALFMAGTGSVGRRRGRWPMLASVMTVVVMVLIMPIIGMYGFDRHRHLT